MLIVSSDVHRAHHALELDSGELIPSWEHPGRADSVQAAIEAAGLGPIVVPERLDRSLVDRVHEPGYVGFVETAHERWVAEGYQAPAAMGFAWPARGAVNLTHRPIDLMAQLGWYSFAADCSIVAGTWAAAAEAAACAQTAADAVDLAAGASSSGLPPTQSAFALCRPPGHHAGYDTFGGYCYLNNAAIAATRLRDRGAARVAIVDVDFHHGNGTQEIFYECDDVVFCSIHGDPLWAFPWFAGHADEIGAGLGEGCNLNLPLGRGTTFEVWMEALGTGLDWVRGHGCDALVVSLGVDTFEGDPISEFALATDDFPAVGGALAGLDLPTVLVLEGGYATDELGANVAGVLAGFAASAAGSG